MEDPQPLLIGLRDLFLDNNRPHLKQLHHSRLGGLQAGSHILLLPSCSFSHLFE